MAILWADNFKNYGTATARMLDGIWAEAGGSLGTDPDPNAVGNVFFNQGGSVSPARARMVYPGTAKNVAGVSVRLWVNSLPTNLAEHTPYILWENNVGTDIIGIRILSDGGLAVVTSSINNSTPTILTSTNPAITARAWNHIEAKVTCGGAAAGALEVRVNGITVLNISGQTWPSSSDVSSVVLGNSSNISFLGVTGYWKDFIIWDTTGSQNNDFLGSVSVFTLYPDSDVSLNWTPSAGSTGWDLIDETTPNDADYISAGDPPPAAAVFDVTNLPPDIVSVRALLPVVRARKIDGGDGNVQMGLTGTLTDLGADRPITTAFTYWWDVSELSPDTAAPWTPVEVDAVKFQIDRTV